MISNVAHASNLLDLRWLLASHGATAYKSKLLSPAASTHLIAYNGEEYNIVQPVEFPVRVLGRLIV